jgi:hypothetical protein
VTAKNSDFRLSDEQLEKAKSIAGESCKKSSCKVCFGRGWIGVSPEDNTIVLCHKCVDQEVALADWKAYVQADPQLWEHYKDMYEEDPEAAGSDEES